MVTVRIPLPRTVTVTQSRCQLTPPVTVTHPGIRNKVRRNPGSGPWSPVSHLWSLFVVRTPDPMVSLQWSGTLVRKLLFEVTVKCLPSGVTGLVRATLLCHWLFVRSWLCSWDRKGLKLLERESWECKWRSWVCDKCRYQRLEGLWISGWCENRRRPCPLGSGSGRGCTDIARAAPVTSYHKHRKRPGHRKRTCG